MFGRKSQPAEYPDDIFDSSRMSFGDHLDELRSRMLRALYGLLFFLVIGFILDGIGSALDKPYIGIGKPMLVIITDPVESQVRDFYFRRAEDERKKKLIGLEATDDEEIKKILKKLEANGNSIDALTYEERIKLIGAPQEMPVSFPVEAFVPYWGDPKPGAPDSP